MKAVPGAAGVTVVESGSSDEQLVVHKSVTGITHRLTPLVSVCPQWRGEMSVRRDVATYSASCVHTQQPHTHTHTHTYTCMYAHTLTIIMCIQHQQCRQTNTHNIIPTLYVFMLEANLQKPSIYIMYQCGVSKVSFYLMHSHVHHFYWITAPLYVAQVSEKISQYARYVFEEVDNCWSVVHEDGEMKVYRRELEEGGVVVDPLKSFYTAGVSQTLVYVYSKRVFLDV